MAAPAVYTTPPPSSSASSPKVSPRTSWAAARREDRRAEAGGGTVAGVDQRDARRDRHEECDLVEPSAKAGPGRSTLLDSHRPPTIAGGRSSGWLEWVARTRHAWMTTRVF